MLLGVCKSGLGGLQIFFASAFIGVDTSHHGKHCCCHTRRVSVVRIAFDFARFTAIAGSELGHDTCGNPFVMVLLAVTLHGHKVVFVNSSLDPEIGFIAEFFEKVAHAVWFAALAGIILAGLVVGVVTGIEVVESLCKFGEAHC